MKCENICLCLRCSEAASEEQETVTPHCSEGKIEGGTVQEQGKKEIVEKAGLSNRDCDTEDLFKEEYKDSDNSLPDLTVGLINNAADSDIELNFDYIVQGHFHQVCSDIYSL